MTTNTSQPSAGENRPEKPGPGGPAFGEWQPIESAPKDGREVILWHADYMAFGYYSPQGWKVTNNGDYLDGGHGNDYLCSTAKYASYQPPTHWMPLPQPPKDAP